MKLALFGAAAVAAAAFVTPALAQTIISGPELLCTVLSERKLQNAHRRDDIGRTVCRCRRSITMHTATMADRNTTIDT